jgi:beta-carotene 15,15'-dioxygenase
MRIALLITGFALLMIQQYLLPVPAKVQFIVFLCGIVLLGVPHGAADLLVAVRNTESSSKKFSIPRFFINYLGRLLLFAAVLWFFPLIGNLLFIVFAAYHFGETDLSRFNTKSTIGKLLVISYGLVILAVILLHHFEEVKPLLSSFEAGIQHAAFINWMDEYRYVLLSVFGCFFFCCTFMYFAANAPGGANKGEFLVQFALLVCILYNLPMMLGFTFYFIVWHSLLSLRNIVRYLRKDGLFSTAKITRQISLYSILAMGGICLFGAAGFMFTDTSIMIVYIFLGLAVLTAPHMQIMHEMYHAIRNRSTNANAETV